MKPIYGKYAEKYAAIMNHYSGFMVRAAREFEAAGLSVWRTEPTNTTLKGYGASFCIACSMIISKENTCFGRVSISHKNDDLCKELGFIFIDPLGNIYARTSDAFSSFRLGDNDGDGFIVDEFLGYVFEQFKESHKQDTHS